MGGGNKRRQSRPKSLIGSLEIRVALCELPVALTGESELLLKILKTLKGCCEGMVFGGRRRCLGQLGEFLPERNGSGAEKGEEMKGKTMEAPQREVIREQLLLCLLALINNDLELIQVRIRRG